MVLAYKVLQFGVPHCKTVHLNLKIEVQAYGLLLRWQESHWVKGVLNKKVCISLGEEG